MDYKALTEALNKAKEAAKTAGAGVYDGGTCNFDNPAMVFDRKEAATIANDYTDKELEEYGSELVSELAEDYRFNANVNRYRKCGY